jgi:hypothetical protein
VTDWPFFFTSVGCAFWLVAWFGLFMAWLHWLREPRFIPSSPGKGWILNALVKALVLAVLSALFLWLGGNL